MGTYRDTIKALIDGPIDGILDQWETESRRLRREILQLQQDLEAARRSAQDTDQDTRPRPDGTPDAPAPTPIAHSRADRVLLAALNEWERVVREPIPGDLREAKVIEGYIRGEHGLGWSTARVGTKNAPYTTNGQFHWCGAWAAYCYGIAGLKKKYRYNYMASCSRLIDGHWKYGHWIVGTPRYVPIDEIQPGDIVIVGPKGRRASGAHITIAYENHGDYIFTLEGNARGVGPNGEKYEGVIKQKRTFDFSNGNYGIMHAIRPLEEDFED